MNITYTFPADCPLPALRGLTCDGGMFDTSYENGVFLDVVHFATRVGGKTVSARVAGKPELMALLAAHKAASAKAAADKQSALELAVPGVGAYERAMRRYTNAVGAYNAASEHGYPMREGAALKSAEAALAAVHGEYPDTVLWRAIEGYGEAAHHEKALAGDAARAAVLAGVPIAEAHAAMDAEWRSAARRCVNNA